jgi:hypothetical protein
MSYLDPTERAAAFAAVNWAWDHGLWFEHASLDALVQAAAELNPPVDPKSLRAYISERQLTEEMGVYAIAFAPPSARLPAGSWNAVPMESTADRARGLCLLITCEPEQIERIRGGAK